METKAEEEDPDTNDVNSSIEVIESSHEVPIVDQELYQTGAFGLTAPPSRNNYHFEDFTRSFSQSSQHNEGGEIEDDILSILEIPSNVLSHQRVDEIYQEAVGFPNKLGSENTLDINFSNEKCIDFLRKIKPFKLPNCHTLYLKSIPVNSLEVRQFFESCFPDEVRVLRFNAFSDTTLDCGLYINEIKS